MSEPRTDGPPSLDAKQTWLAARRCVRLLGPAERRRWALLLPFTLLAALLEAGGAALIFTLIRFISAPESLADNPWMTRVRQWSGLQAQEDFLVAFAAAVAGFYLVKNAGLIFQTYYTARSAGLSVDSLANRLLGGYLLAPYAHHLGRSSSELIRNTNDAVVSAYRSMLMALVQAASEVALMLALVAVLIVAAPGVTLLAIGGVTAVILLFLRLSQRHLVGWGYESHVLHGKMLSELNQSLAGIKEVKVLGRERFFMQAYAGLRARLSRLIWRRTTLENAPRLTMETFFVLAVVLVILVYEQRGSSREIVPVLGLFAYTGFRMLPGLHRIVSHVNMIRFGSPAIEEIYEDARRFGVLASNLPADRAPPMPFTSKVEIRNLTFTYDEERGPALVDVDLEIRRGESIGIVGSTGAGKSTFVDLLLGLLEPEQGQILIDGVDVRTDERGWRANIGYVPQTIYLVDDDLRRNIALGIERGEIDEARVQSSMKMAQLDGLVGRLPKGLKTVVGERGVRLSGGERQRVAIARALYHEPSVLVFDEATSSLDNKTEREITRAIEGFRGEKTIVVIAHRLSTVKACDRILFLERGRVIAEGPYAQLLEDNPQFRELAAAE